MEEKNTNSDTLQEVNVYITLDSSDLGRMKAKQAKRKQPARSNFSNALSDALEDLNLTTNCQFVVSRRGVLLFIEMILSITLIVVTATNYRLYEGQPVGITMNSITLVADILHVVVMVTGIIELLPSQAIIISVQLLKNILLLLLQFVAFIVYATCGYGSHAASIILTLILCCVMILSIFYTSKRYKPMDGKKPKMYKKSKRKGASYKRLRRY